MAWTTRGQAQGPENLAARQTTRRLLLGGLPVGAGAPVSVQSMVRSGLADSDAVLEEIQRLAGIGCQVIRVALVDDSQLDALARVAKSSVLPLVADVHYPFRLALAALEMGAHGVRVNPLVPWDKHLLRDVARLAEERRAVIRVGINAGRWPSDLPLTPQALVDRVLERADMLAQRGADQIKCSVKSSDPAMTLQANRLLARQGPWPIHLGLTEAGPGLAGAARSAAVMGRILSEGIGDTIRVSLSGPACDEVVAAREILRALGLLHRGALVVSCPGCGRSHADVAEAALFVQRALAGVEEPITVAVMGCEINGPGEAAGADVGIAATSKGWQLFSQGSNRGALSWEEGPRRLVALALEATRIQNHSTGEENQ